MESKDGQCASVIFRYEDFQEEIQILSTAAEPTNVTTTEDAENLARIKRDERMKLKKRLENQDGMCLRRPLSYWWRQGRFPDAKEILRGKALLKAYAVGLFILFAIPRTSIRRRRLEYRAAEQAEDRKSIVIGTDLCVGWLGKLARLPLLSVYEDHGLCLDPTNNNLLWGLDQWQVKKRAMRLKVRVRYILRTICQELPPTRVLNILQLLMTDGRYLHDEYLYPHEQSVLEFDEFGATRRMIFPMRETETSGFPKHVLEQMQDRSRCRMVLINLIFVKVLICRVILVPWNAGVCRLPNPAYLGQMVEDLRHIASLTFAVVKNCDHNIPPFSSIGPEQGVDTTRESYWNWISDKFNEWLRQLLGHVDTYDELINSNQHSHFDWEFLSKWLYPPAVYATPELEQFIQEYRDIVSDWTDR